MLLLKGRHMCEFFIVLQLECRPAAESLFRLAGQLCAASMSRPVAIVIGLAACRCAIALDILHDSNANL